jgi:hypothetical protein
VRRKSAPNGVMSAEVAIGQKLFQEAGRQIRPPEEPQAFTFGRHG